MADLVAFQARIYGKVQGVYYRDFTQRHAVRLGLTGYVCNLRDRSVQVQAEGTRDKLDELVECLKLGPPGARVDDIKIEWQTCTGSYRGFSVTG